VTRAQLEHVIRAAAAIADVDELVIVGSQAILGSFPDAPAELIGSLEADLYLPDDPAAGDLVDGAIGEESPFHESFGYYAHGVGPETAVLPRGWRDRSVVIRSDRTRGVRAICPGPADLAVSKLVASREKDRAFVAALLRHGLVGREDMEAVAALLPPPHDARVRELLRNLRA
jgi:hypothetical protein